MIRTLNSISIILVGIAVILLNISIIGLRNQVATLEKSIGDMDERFQNAVKLSDEYKRAKEYCDSVFKADRGLFGCATRYGFMYNDNLDYFKSINHH